MPKGTDKNNFKGTEPRKQKEKAIADLLERERGKENARTMGSYARHLESLVRRGNVRRG